MNSSYLIYFLIAVGMSLFLSAAFGRFRGENSGASHDDDQEFNRRIAAIEQKVRHNSEDGRSDDGDVDKD